MGVSEAGERAGGRRRGRRPRAVGGGGACRARLSRTFSAPRAALLASGNLAQCAHARTIIGTSVAFGFRAFRAAATPIAECGSSV